MTQSGFKGFLSACAMVVAGHVGAATVSFDVAGDADDLATSLRSASLTIEAAADEDAPVEELIAAARADYARLLGALYERGRYGGTISIKVDGAEASELSALSFPGTVSQVVIRVQPGPRFRFSEAVVEPVAPGTVLPEEFARRRTARTPVMRQAVEAAVDGWRDVGHAKVKPTSQQIRADHKTSTVSARFTLDPGPRLVFGDTIVTSESRVRARRILQIAGIPEGAVFSPEAVEEAGTRLRRTGTFRSVVVREAETPNPDGSLDMEIEVADEKRRRLGVGVEASSTEGLALSAFWLHRNLRGGAERFRFDAEARGIGGDSGGIDYTLKAALTRPSTLGPGIDLRFNTLLERLDEPSFLSETVELSLGLERIYSDEFKAGIFFGYRYSDTEDGFGKRTFEHLTATVEGTWDTRDDPLNATSGYYLAGEAKPYLGLSGSANGARLTGDARIYRALGETTGTVLAGRLQFGSIVGSDLEDTPPDFLFFSGGGGTVRGQAYQSLGVDVNGQTVGGRSFLGISAEVRQVVTDSIGVVGFFDAGYIGESEFVDDTGEWHSGGGLGVRYLSPLGPIRLDVGVPLSGGGDDVGVYIGIGQAF